MPTFVSTEGPFGAKIMFIGEAPGEVEDQLGKPFRGPAGKTFDKLLSQSGISRYECLVTNVARERPPGNKIAYYFEDKNCTKPRPILQGWIDLLKKEIEKNGPNIIVAMGRTAIWALTGETRVKEFAGYILPCTLVPGKKVLVTYHPQAVGYDQKLFWPVVMDLKKANRNSSSPRFQVDNRDMIAGASYKQFTNYLTNLLTDPGVKSIALDIEAPRNTPYISIIGIADSSQHGMSFQVISGKEPTISLNEEVHLWSMVASVLSCKGVIMHNATYDAGVLWYKNHIFCDKIKADTLLAAHALWPEMQRDLGFLASKCLNVPPWKGSMRQDSLYYNVSDAVNTYGIWEVLERELIRTGDISTFQFEMEQLQAALMLQLQGLHCNTTVQEELLKEARTKRDEYKELLDKAVGTGVNYRSPKQLQKLLYIDLGLPIQYRRRKSVNDPKIVSSDASALKRLAMLVPDNPVFNLLMAYKKQDKLMSFIDIEPSPEGKVHTSYNITGATETEEEAEGKKNKRRSFGRWSSSKSIIIPYGSGNLQNIPDFVRKMYSAPPGYVIIQADYVQAEAVVVSYLINDYKMIDIFRKSFGLKGEARKPFDIHRMTASDMFSIPLDEVTKEQRTIGKTIRHASNYSMGPNVLAVQLGLPKLSMAKNLLDLYHSKCPQLRLWHVQIQEELRKGMTLTNLLGRKHRFHGFWGDELFRSAYAYKPQSTVGDLLNESVANIYKEMGGDVSILLQLHDAVYTYCKPDEVKEVMDAEYKIMTRRVLEANHQEFRIDTDFKVGDNWGEMAEI